MIITQHGKNHPLYKTSVRHNGIGLVFFGWSPEHVVLKESEWLANNSSVSDPRERARLVLRLVAGGKQ